MMTELIEVTSFVDGEDKQHIFYKPTNCYFCGEPIIKMSGQDSDSHCEHHISYVPEIKTDSHIGCHTRFHMTNKDHVRRPIREIPKKGCPCFFCGEPIVKMNGWESDSLLIHSLDGNHDNWTPENKVPSHFGCHTSFHSSGEKNPMYGVHKFGEEAPNYGNKHTEESKKKIKESNRKTWINKTPEELTEHGRKICEGRASWTLKERTDFSKKMKNFTKQWWDNATPEQRTEQGRKMSEGRKRSKLRRNN